MIRVGVMLLLVGVVACTDTRTSTTGHLNEPCNRDGTCIGADLFCHDVQPGAVPGHEYRCVAAGESRSQADEFCDNCVNRCGDAGMKSCSYTAPGEQAKCECK